MSIYSGPNRTQNGLLLNLDFGNSRCYISGSTARDLINNSAFTITNSGFTSLNSSNGSLRIPRQATLSNTGYLELVGSGSLSSSNYLYNNHTTSIWAKINNRNPSGENGTETNSALCVYAGFHGMWRYDISGLIYSIWNQNSNQVAAPNLMFNSMIFENTWMNAVVVRSGNTLSTFLNGVLIGTNSFSAPVAGYMTNNLRIAAALGSNNEYNWRADMDFAILQMYNRALSPDEVLYNFCSQRGRFGI